MQKIYPITYRARDNGPKSSFFLSTVFRNVKQYRFLLKEMVKATLTSQYKRSLLGISWLFITPVLTILAWLLLHSSGIFNPGDTGIPYPAYVLLSTAIWTFFVSFYKLISDALILNGKLFIQLRFPHELLIWEKMIIAVINFTIPLLVSIIVLLFFDVSFSWHIVLFPFALIPLMLFGAAVGIFFSLLKVVAIDLNNFFDHVIILLMYATPVVYSERIDSKLLQSIMEWNPLTYLISFPRELLISGHFYAPVKFLYVSLGVTVLFLFMLRYFLKAESKVIERLTVS
jgi:homopolymeric O-antigen transport system permease protein